VFLEVLLRVTMVWCPSIRGEKVGAFFGGGGRCIYFGGDPGVDDGYIILRWYFLGESSPRL
jgi:L-ascorbate metabolism protein UlaG (beta-lactamase superfamily)